MIAYKAKIKENHSQHPHKTNENKCRSTNNKKRKKKKKGSACLSYLIYKSRKLLYN